jgi:hypothetical protein
MGENKAKALIGIEAILRHIGVGKSIFAELVTAGLPARKLRKGHGSWVSHPDPIDEWFQIFTRTSNKETPGLDDESCL